MKAEKTWKKIAKTTDIPHNGGACVKVGKKQIAIFHSSHTGQWYATQNLCPHKKEMALSRGMIGSEKNIPKVACPFHKKTYSLEDGTCLSGDEPKIRTYAVKVENEDIYLEL